MKCKKCGAEIESKLLYCPNCGESIQLVPEYDVLEEELLSRVVEDKNKSKDKFATGVYQNTEKNVSAAKTVTKKIPYFDKKHLMISVVAFFAIVIIGFCIIGSYLGKHTYNSVMNSAVEAEEDGQYAKALGYFDEAYRLDNDSFEAVYGLGRMYYRVKDYKKAIEYLSIARELDTTNTKIYSYLLESYAALKDTDGIYQLAELAPNDEILQMISSYFVSAPVFSEKGGDYEDDLTIYLSAASDCQIFYTLNGKDPTTSGKLYKNGITLKEGTTEIRAVALNSEGDYSEIVSQTYTVSYVGMSAPVVSPSAGSFSTQEYITITVPEGCKAYYSWDGSDPSEGGIEYSEPFPIISGSSILTVVIVDSNGNKSPLYRGQYDFN